MIRFVVLILVSFLFLGCQKPDQVEKRPETISPPQVKLETKQERKDSAVSKVQQAAASQPLPSRAVYMTGLEGRLVADLYADYLGVPKGTRIPATLSVTFEERMSDLYQRKLMFQKCDKKGNCNDVSETVISQFPDLYKQYLDRDKKKMSLKEFIVITEKKIAAAKQSLNWNAVCRRYEDKKKTKKENEKRCNLLQAVVSKLAGKDMLAYGMTELLPSNDGRFNTKYLDILLQNAGAEFLYRVPAMADGYASLGLYQFTMFAIRKDDEATEGASIINDFVKEGGEKIPDSVVKLSGHEHHVAAFYFAVHNIARLVTSLTSKGVETLAK